MSAAPVSLAHAAPPVLRIEGLSIRLPAGADRPLAVEGVDLQLHAGETLCVVGESGSGKSMIANAVMGLLPGPQVAPVAGRILFEGRDLLALSEDELRALRGCRMGMVFQEPMTSLNPVMRIGEQIGEVLDAHQSLPAPERRARIVAALRDVGLPEPELIADAFPFRLSGGQRQRVMIAAALVLQPKLLIADEPTTALDVTTQAQILALMRELQQRRGMALLFITHDFGVVAQIADRVAVMQFGRVVERGPARQVLRAPQHGYTQRLIAAIPSGQTRAAPTAGFEPLLQVDSLAKTYRSGGGLWRKSREVQAARDLSFSLQAGETLGLVGESGSGKSTVGRCLTGLVPADAGRIRFGGQELPLDLRRRPVADRGRIQMVFQDPYASLNPRHTVGAAIAAGPLQQGVPPAEVRERVRALLEQVGLKADAAGRYPHEFSGGQRQRIAIARALAMRPQLLVADEPVSALDVSVQAQVLDLFEQVRRDFGLSMVFITHDLRVAARMCDRIAVMRRGEIVEMGATADVLDAPRHEYTRELLAAAPNFRSTLDKDTDHDPAFVAA
ncbi:ABC transporter ATP-binding protein [Ramlibacter tataouinensis]|uniref:ABC transporter ATP-binding protein n=1 Tax=Ramlibacter tataouinensis TaxID=94132 RepID=UPI0022F3B8AE|nr:ABC transporter ATP-binding protein [Ramlibacter tataouinensis]WBY01223.1 ABC transporter ATP-binding protein [Ramlibacter tataouinensis]